MSGYKSISFIIDHEKNATAFFSKSSTHEECEKEIRDDGKGDRIYQEESYGGFVKLQPDSRLERLLFILAEIEGDLGDEGSDMENLFARIFEAGFEAGEHRGVLLGRRQEMDRKEKMNLT